MEKASAGVKGEGANRLTDCQKECLTNSMTDLADIIQFSTLNQFQAVYGNVSDEVYLFQAGTGYIEASNRCLDQAAHESVIGRSIFELFQFDFSSGEDGVFEQLIKAGEENNTTWKLYISTVEIGHKKLKMAVASKEVVSVANMEAEKRALLNEVYHRVKNNLNIMVSLLSLQLNRVKDPATRHLLTESKSRLFTLSLLQQKLYNSSRISEIKAGNYLQSLALSVFSTFKPTHKQLQLKTDVEEHWLNIDTLVPLGLITHELIANALLHAFEQQEAGEIELGFNRLPDSRFLLKVKDNGSGMQEGKKLNEFNSLGFQLINSLVKQLKADIFVENKLTAGSCFMVEFEEVQK